MASSCSTKWSRWRNELSGQLAGAPVDRQSGTGRGPRRTGARRLDRRGGRRLSRSPVLSPVRRREGREDVPGTPESGTGRTSETVGGVPIRDTGPRGDARGGDVRGPGYRDTGKRGEGRGLAEGDYKKSDEEFRL